MRLTHNVYLRLSLTAPLLLLIAGASLAAGQGTHDMPAVLTQLPPSQGCPVSFSADVKPAGRLDLAATAGPRARATTVELRFELADGPPVREVDATLHGLAGGARMLEAAGAHPDAAGATTQSFSLVPVTARDGSGHAELKAVTMPIVNWAELTRIVYADGAAWTPARGARCSAAPNGLQPVAIAR